MRYFVCLAVLWGASCASVVYIDPPQKGSVANPVRCDMPLGQRDYLKRLRSEDNRKIAYEYVEAVLGPEGRILDIFKIENPAFRKGSGLFGENPENPRHFYIYMDMYHPNVRDMEAIPGYRLLGQATNADQSNE